MLNGMTATQVIRQIKALPKRERRKVYRFVYRDEVPNKTTLHALAEDVSKMKQFSSVEEFMADIRR